MSDFIEIRNNLYNEFITTCTYYNGKNLSRNKEEILANYVKFYKFWKSKIKQNTSQLYNTEYKNKFCNEQLKYIYEDIGKLQLFEEFTVLINSK